MPIRTRSAIESVKGRGTRDRFTWVDTPAEAGGNFVRSAATCVDVSPSDGGQPFTVVRDYCDGGVINMPLTNYFTGYFHDYTCDYLVGGSWKGSHWGTDSPRDTDVANIVTAGSNPSRPWVDMVAGIAQLPQGLKTIQENFKQFYGAGKVAQTYLKYSFDIAPNVSDLLKIILFQDKVNDRIKELERLKKRGLRRTIRVGTYEFTSTEMYPVQSVDAFINVEVRTHTTEEVWGYITWTPDFDFPSTPDSIRRLAARATYGLTVDAATIWELVPWSWLMDWSASFGEYFAATRNIVPATPSAVQVMRHKKTRRDFGAYADDSKGLTMTPGYCVTEIKTRTLASPSVSAHMPLLNAGHASILGSIAVLNQSGPGRRYRYR